MVYHGLSEDRVPQNAKVDDQCFINFHIQANNGAWGIMQ
jgi:hypothetical protein